jgi:hypothetical protein
MAKERVLELIYRHGPDACVKVLRAHPREKKKSSLCDIDATSVVFWKVGELSWLQIDSQLTSLHSNMSESLFLWIFDRHTEQLPPLNYSRQIDSYTPITQSLLEESDRGPSAHHGCRPDLWW